MCTPDFHIFLRHWSSSRCNLTHRSLHFFFLFCPRTSYLPPNWILFFLDLGYKFSSPVPLWRGVNLYFIQIFANLLNLTNSNPRLLVISTTGYLKKIIWTVCTCRSIYFSFYLMKFIFVCFFWLRKKTKTKENYKRHYNRHHFFTVHTQIVL